MNSIHVSEFAAVLSGLSSFLVSAGLTYWVYKTQAAIITSLKEEVKNLKEEVSELKKDKSKWYHKAVKLATILQETQKCPHGRSCQVRVKFEKYVEDEGVI
jgi:prefoldin subunit 5